MNVIAVERIIGMKNNKKIQILESRILFKKRVTQSQTIQINYMIGLIACALNDHNLTDLQKHMEMFHVYQIHEFEKFKEYLRNRK